jgi:hypothetical protein
MPILTFLFAAYALAGNGNVVGNGGAVVHCPAPHARSEVFFGDVALLDLAEGKDYGYHYRKLAELRALPLAEAFPRAVSLFLARSAFYSARFRQRFLDRELNTRWAAELPFLGAWSPWLEARGCRVRQAAIQYGAENPSPEDSLALVLATPVWKGLAPDQQAALLFHEFFLKDRLFQQGSCAVNNVRHLTAYVLSDEALAATASDWEFETNRNCHLDPQRD